MSASNGTNAALLEVRSLTTSFATERGTVHAVTDVSLDVARGQTLAIVGESGSGKSVLTRSLLGLLSARRGVAVTGSSTLGGTDLVSAEPDVRRRLLAGNVGLVSQNPMTALNPVVRVGRQLTEGLRRHLGLGAATARQRAVELLELVGVPEPRRRMRAYPHELSGGLRQRVVIAIAISCDPALLIADEPTTALDVTIQAQILQLLGDLQRERGMGMIIISHDLGVVARFADQVAVMYAGRIVEHAPTGQLFAAPAMPYTEALLGAIPSLDNRSTGQLRVIPGRPPDLVDHPSGCSFATRCSYTQDQCSARPLLAEVADGHRCACWFPRHRAAITSGDRHGG